MDIREIRRLLGVMSSHGVTRFIMPGEIHIERDGASQKVVVASARGTDPKDAPLPEPSPEDIAQEYDRVLFHSGGIEADVS